MPSLRANLSFCMDVDDRPAVGDRIAQSQLAAAYGLLARGMGPVVFNPRFQYGLPGGVTPYGEATEIRSAGSARFGSGFNGSEVQGAGVISSSIIMDDPSVKRTLYVRAGRANLLNNCEKHRLEIQVLQQLDLGVLRVVMHSSKDAAQLKDIYGSKASQGLSSLQMRI